MNRSSKLALYGLVLSGMVGGTAAYASAGTSVNLQVDGQTRHVHTAARTVGAALADLGVTVDAHDIVAPDEATSLADGTTIVVRHAHPLHVVIDGKGRDLWVHATSVGEALDQLGFGSRDAVSVSRSQRLDSSVTSIQISTPKAIVFKVDHKTIRTISAGPTVADAARDAGIVLADADRTSAPRTSLITRNETITVSRVTLTQRTEVVQVAAPTLRQNDATAWEGTETVVSEGSAGSSRVTFQLSYVEGRYAGRTALATVVLQAPKARVIKVGTKPAPWLDNLAADDPRRIAGGMLLQQGMGEDQYDCLDNLWTKESGWRTDAYNPSGAYGIPQSLPGSKMAAFGDDWETSARTQIAWGLSYISSVYGDPCTAWGHSQATNWY